MTPTKTVLLLAASGLALTLGGCKLDNRPLLARFKGPRPPAPAAVAPAAVRGIDAPPPAAATAYLPRPPPLPSENAYPYAERARVMDRIVNAAPPAYAFDYGGAEPWAWEAADDSLMFAEPYGDGYRFYYYEPGAPYPYFVRDPGYGYAFGPNGALLAMFDAAGALIAADRYNRYYPDARSYWSHGYDLQRAYDAGRRRRVDPGVWAARAPRLRQVEQHWIEAPRNQPAWREWRASRGERFARADLAPPPVAGPPRGDNGRHLGWERGRREGRNGQVERAQVESPPPQAREGHGGRNRGDEIRSAAPPQASAPERRHGGSPRPAAPMAARPGHPHGHGQGRHIQPRPPGTRAPDGGHHGHANSGPPAPQVQARGGGEGHGHGGGGHGGGGQPAPQPQHQPQGGGQPQGHGGGGHGGGHGGGKEHGHQH